MRTKQRHVYSVDWRTTQNDVLRMIDVLIIKLQVGQCRNFTHFLGVFAELNMFCNPSTIHYISEKLQFQVGEIRRIRFEENCCVDAYLNIVSH